MIGGLVAELKERFEVVVVVDDGSSDRTSLLARKQGCCIITL